MREIERIPCPSRQEFVRDIRPLDRPFVFVGALDRWPALRRWSFAMFRETYGEHVVSVEPGRLFDCTQVSRFGNVVGSTRLRMPLRELIDRTSGDTPERLYLTEWRIFEDLPDLARDMPPDTIRDPLLSVTPKCYIGPAHTFTPLHFDYAPNLTAHLVGRKRWVAYPPSETHRLYKYPWPGRLAHFSRVSSLERLRDHEAFPKLAAAASIETIVEEGEMIYMPERWWHHVESLAPSISLHLFWKTWPLFARQLAFAPVDKLLRRRQGSYVDPRDVLRRLVRRA
jgi:lysine-specific demethylase 8